MAEATALTVQSMVATAKGRVRNLSAEEVASELERGEVLLVELMRMGYQAVAHLDGGLEAWREQGRPVEFVGGER